MAFSAAELTRVRSFDTLSAAGGLGAAVAALPAFALPALTHLALLGFCGGILVVAESEDGADHRTGQTVRHNYNKQIVPTLTRGFAAERNAVL
jgi:hypothetical protein